MPTAVADDLDQFVANYHASGAPKKATGGDDDLDAFVSSFKSSQAPEAPAVTAGGTPTEKASRVGRGIQLEPPAFDLTQVPRDPFTNRPITAPPIRTTEETAREGTIGPTPTHSIIGTQRNPFPGEDRQVTERSLEDIARSTVPLAFRDQQNDPNDTQIIHPEGLLTPVEQQRHPVVTGLAQALGGLTTPENIALTAGTAGVGEAPGLLGKALKFGFSAAFGTQMAKGVYDEIPGIKAAWDRGDMSEVKRLATIAGVNTALAGGAFGHAGRELNEGVNGEPVPTTVPKGTVSAPLMMDDAQARGARRMQDFEANAAARKGISGLADAEQGVEAAKQARINAPVELPRTFNPDEQARVVKGPVQGPESNPLEREAAQVREQQAKNPPPYNVVDKRRVGAGEDLAPESPATLRKQVDALAEGTNKVVYFPKGTENLPAPPDNAVVTNVPGDKPGSGVYYHEVSVTPEQIKSSVEDGSYGKLLGHLQTKEEASVSGVPATVVARDVDGSEAKSSVVAGGDANGIAAQAAELARQFPKAKIGVETPEQVISGRQGVPVEPPQGARETAASAQTPGLPTQFRTDKAANTAAVKATPEQLADTFRTDKARLEQSRRSASDEEKALIDQRITSIDQHLQELTGDKPVQKFSERAAPEKLQKFEGDPHGQRMAQLYANRLRNPVEREFAMSYLKARLAGKAAPAAMESIADRAQPIRGSIERYLGEKAPQSLEEKYDPETLKTAKEELQQAHDLASNFERPGRFQKIVEGSQYDVGGAWYGVGSSRHIVADQFPWYGDIEQGADKLGELIKKGKGAEYDRLLSSVADSIQREKESAAPVIAEFSPRLKSLSDEIDGHDEELSSSLAQLATGDGRGFKNLREYIQGKIDNAEQARDFFKLIDAAAAEAREAGAEEPAEPRSEVRGEESEGTAGNTASPRSGEDSERATGAERPAGSANPNNSEAFSLTPEKNRSKKIAPPQDLLPGLDEFVEEQKRGAAKRHGEALTTEANSPKNIESAAGEMEQKSPLFRGTEASAQRELPTDVKDLIDGNGKPEGTRYSGISPAALKKMLPESWKAKLESEVAANAHARNLQGGLYDLDSQVSADMLRARDVLRDAPGTPKDMEAIYHHLEDSTVKLTAEQQKILDTHVHPLLDAAKKAYEKLKTGGVPVEDEGYVHRIPLDKGNMIDRALAGEGKIGAGNLLSQSSPGTKTRTMMALEDKQGNRRVVSIKNGEVTAWDKGKSEDLGKYRKPAEPGVDEFYDKHVMQKLEKLASDLGISHERTAKGFGGNVMGRSLTGQNAIETLAGTPEQVILHEIGHQLDERYNLQDKFVKDPAIKKELRDLVDLKWEGQQTSKYFKQYVRKGAEKIAAMFETFLHAPERFHQVAPKTYGKFTEFLASHAETKPILDIKPSMVIGGRNIGAVEKIPGTFVDKDGKRWDVTQATTKEIEANTNTRYYKNALASATVNYLQMRRAERAFDFLEDYKKSPEFQEVAAKIGGGNKVPPGWRGTDLPQFHGYVFEPHTAEVLDWFNKRMKGGDAPGIYDQVGNFLRTAIFFNPLIHTPNIAVHWAVEKGVTGWVAPKNWVRIAKTGARAIDAVMHQNQDYLDALDAGAPLQTAREGRNAVTQLLLERMGKELGANQGYAAKLASALGYANPAKLIKAIYDFSGKVTWTTNDVAMLQAAYEHQARTNQTFKEAITDVSKHIPDYRLPTRIFNSPQLAKLMANPKLTMFGAYHYGALRSYGEMAKSFVDENVPQGERLKSLDRLAMLGLVTFAAYPALDQLAKLITGDKTAEFRRAGASTFIYNLAQLARGEKTPTDVVTSVATPAVQAKAVTELAMNRDLRTGKHIYEPSAPGKDIAKQLGRYVGKSISPISQTMDIGEGKKTLGQQAAGLVGIKTRVPTPAESLARRYAADAMGNEAPDADTMERANLRRGYEDKLRDKSTTPEQLAKDRAAGKLTAQDQKIILQRAARTPLQNAMRNLSPEQSLRVWEKASPEEQQQIRAMLANKLNGLSKVPVERRADVKAKILAALHPAQKQSGLPMEPPG